MARFNRKGKKNGRKDRTITQRRLNSLRGLVANEALVECCVGPGDKTIALKKWEARLNYSGCEHWNLIMAKQPQYIQNAMKTLADDRITVISDEKLEELKELSKKGPNARMNAEKKGRRQHQGRTSNRNHIDPPNDSKGWSESKKNERRYRIR